MNLAERISRWLGEVDDEVAARAVLGTGLEFGQMGARISTAEFARATGRPRWPATIPWRADAAAWRHAMRGVTAEARAASYPLDIDRILRVGVPLNTPIPLLPWLLRSDAVASAFVSVERPASALRRRPWRWPFRVGTLGVNPASLDDLQREIRNLHSFPARLLDLRRVESEPQAVDVLVVHGPVDAAAGLIVARGGPVSNAVLIFDVDHGWVVPTTAVDTIRTVTGAVAVAMCDTGQVAPVLDRVIADLSHGVPFDVAVTNATARRALLVAEAPGLERAHLPTIARRLAHRTQMARARLEPTEIDDLRIIEEELTSVADGRFRSERDEASEIASLTARAEATGDALAEREDRWLQATVGEVGAARPDNVIKRGRNDVRVHIGPQQEWTLAAPAPFADTDLPWDEEDADAFRLTVAFVPLHPPGRPQRADTDLPRFGSSDSVTFRWDVRRRSGTPLLTDVSARIVVLFRNRVLQTAVLTGTVGDAARLEEMVAALPTMDGLDDRQPFDLAIVANHDDRGGRDVAALIAASNGHIALATGGSVPSITTQLANILGRTVSMTQPKTGLATNRARTLLIDLATTGRDLHNELEELGPIDGAKRIQVLTARGSWYLPIELAYQRYAPDQHATVCDRFIGGADSCDSTCPATNDRSIVCPNAFLGLRTIVERLHYRGELHAGMTAEHLVVVAPRAKRRRVTLQAPAVGISGRVRDTDATELQRALGSNAVRASGWGGWCTAIASADHDLLVLLPHTQYGSERSFLEIDDTTLERGAIEADSVRRNQELKPVVILFGCRTAGIASDPSGFAVRFLQKGAALVFGSLTMLLGRHAAALAGRLTSELSAGVDDHVLVAEALVSFRRAAVRDGLLAGLAVTSYGDADWTV